MAFQCPNCGKPIVSLASNKCSYCSAEFPESMRLSPEERARIDQSLADEEQHLRETIEKKWQINNKRHGLPEWP